MGEPIRDTGKECSEKEVKLEIAHGRQGRSVSPNRQLWVLDKKGI